MDDAAFARLLAWLSPSFPVGAYSYSHGIETAVAEGMVSDVDDLIGWLVTLLLHGGVHVDACLFRAAYPVAGDEKALAGICAVGTAQRGAAELGLETTAQGAAFLTAVNGAWPHPWLARLAGLASVPYPVAVAVACAAHRVPEQPGLHALLHAFAANLVSAALRLIPLGQSDGQRAIVAKPRLYSGEAAEKGQLELVLTEGGDHCGVVGTGHVLHLHPKLPGKVISEYLVTPGQTGCVLVGDAANLEHGLAIAAAGRGQENQDCE